MAFQKGQSGNPGGRPKEKPFADALRMEIASAGADKKALRAIARALIEKAQSGDLQAITVLADRLDGKPAQTLDATIRNITAKQMSDDELADIAAGSGDGAAEAPVDPAQLN